MDAYPLTVGFLVGALLTTVLPALIEWWRAEAWPWLRWRAARPTIETTGEWPRFHDELVRWKARRP